jgi:TIR domain
MAIVVSYAHDDGEHLARLVVERLRAEGFIVAWDQDLRQVNPSSIHEWMEHRIAEDLVICVVSRMYIEHFGRGLLGSTGRGVLFESRAIELRLHDHTSLDSCPVIPVAPAILPHEAIPPALRRPLVTKIDAETLDGFSELISRIRALERARPQLLQPHPASNSTNMNDTASAELRRLLHQLESARPGEPGAIDAVLRWLNFAREHPDEATILFAEGFPAAQQIAKSAGDILLVRELSRACLEAVNRTGPKLKAELALEARILVCGEAWHLQRSYHLQEALDAAMRGLEVAKSVGDRITEALAKKCLGRLERIMAEELSHEHDAGTRLDSSIDWLQDAQNMLAIDATESDERGDCLSLEARTWLVKYRHTNNEQFLRCAFERIDDAQKLISPENSKIYWDMLILKAELELDSRRFSVARRIATSAIERLQRSDGSSRSEILARALRLRSLVTERSRERKGLAAAIRDLDKAEAIFVSLGQDRAVAECQWRKIMLDPSLATDIKVPYKELRKLESIASDPRRRLKAIQRFDLEERSRLGTAVGYRIKEIDWIPILRRADLDRRYPR